MFKQQKFSIRKYAVGVASVLIGISFLAINPSVTAAELSSTSTAETLNSINLEESTLTSESIDSLETSSSISEETVTIPEKHLEPQLTTTTESFDKIPISLNTQPTITTKPVNSYETTDEISQPKEPSSDIQITAEPDSEKESIPPTTADTLAPKTIEKESTTPDSANPLEQPTAVSELAEVEKNPSSLNNFTTINLTSTIRENSNGSIARGDDYPDYLKNAIPDSIIDPWRLWNRECTSFTAYRLSSVNKFELPPAYGNGGEWGYRAQREGYIVDMNPAKGSVAWDSTHVAWVSNVVGDMVEIEEYNYGWNHNYHKRMAHKSSFLGFIHFKDIADGAVSTPTPDPNTGGNNSLPPTGTYRFTSRLGIKNEPKISSPDIAYYDNGMSVNYDKTLEADNYLWISYLSYSGSRHYIAVNKLDKKEEATITGNINITNKNDKAGTFDVVISNVSSNKGVAEIKIPTWSTQNGQDDIVWYKATKQADGSYKTSVSITNHKNNRGEYNVHVYYTLNDGSQKGLGGTTVNVAQPATDPVKPAISGNITILNKNDNKGTFDVLITNAHSEKGIKEVKVPIWSDRNGQDDIKWYVATKQSDNIYKVSVDISNHKNDTGKYHVHVYYLQNDNQDKVVGGTTVSINKSTTSPAPTLPPSGTYRFSDRRAVQPEPRISSEALAYYGAGDTVHYDKVLTADGHQWISYIATSGNRRYIAVNKL